MCDELELAQCRLRCSKPSLSPILALRQAICFRPAPVLQWPWERVLEGGQCTTSQNLTQLTAIPVLPCSALGLAVKVLLLFAKAGWIMDVRVSEARGPASDPGGCDRYYSPRLLASPGSVRRSSVLSGHMLDERR